MENKTRCGWCLSSDLYKKYHDEEWGVPVYDDQKIFEFLILETFQARQSWITILKKRNNFRLACNDFDYRKVAQYSEEKIQDLLLDTGIIRNQLKIHSAVANAVAFIKVQEEFGCFSKYIWGFTNGISIDNQRKSLKEVPATSPLSDTISKDLKKRGFKFVSSKVVYAHMQATGMVNDHIADCWKKTNQQLVSKFS